MLASSIKRNPIKSIMLKKSMMDKAMYMGKKDTIRRSTKMGQSIMN
jgi:hypothetical protein